MSDALRWLREVRDLVRETSRAALPIMEQAIPVAARQLQELSERVSRAWNRAYGEFAEARALAYDIAVTFGIPTRVSAGPKEVKNITRDSEESLVGTISWIANRFKQDYEREVIRRGADVRAAARRLAEVAEEADSLEDPEVREAAEAFVRVFLPFRTAVGDHLYRPLGGIIRRAEEIINRYLPPERRPERPPAGKRGSLYRGTPLPSLVGVVDSARQIIERLDTFVRLSEPTLGEIEKLASLAEEVVKEYPVEVPPKELAPSGEPSSATEVYGGGSVHKRKRVTEWMALRWEEDPEIGAFI